MCNEDDAFGVKDFVEILNELLACTGVTAVAVTDTCNGAWNDDADLVPDEVWVKSLAARAAKV